MLRYARIPQLERSLMKKRLIALTSAVTLLVPTVSYAEENSPNPEQYSSLSPVERISECMNEVPENGQDEAIDFELVCKAIAAADSTSFSDDGKRLETSLDDAQLASNYGFTADELVDYHAILNGTYSPKVPVEGTSFRSTSIYLTSDQLTTGTLAVLGTAAAVGPEALAAAVTSVSFALGPVAGAISGGIALLGAAFFADLAIKIVTAINTNRGVRLTLVAGFPPIDSRVE